MRHQKIKGGDEMRGVIERILEKQGEHGRFYAVCVAGEWYTCFEDLSDFKEGDLVSFEVRENGEYRNLVNVRKVGQDESQRIEEMFEDKKKRMLRSVALKAAVELVKNVQSDDLVRDALEVAGRFEEWLRR